MSINWDAVHQKLFGRPAGAPETKEQKVLQRLVDDYRKVVLRQGKSFVAQVAVEADKAGFPLEYLPYIFFIIKGKRSDWPSMGKNVQRALGVGRDIMDASLSTPNSYRDALTLPPSEVEDAADKTIKNLAMWSATSMAVAIGTELSKLLKKYGKEVEKLRDDVPKGRGDTYLRAVLTQALNDNPGQFTDGLLLWDVLYSLF